MITKNTQLTPGYIGPVSTLDVFPSKNQIYHGIWEVLRTSPIPCENITSRGVVVERNGAFECVVPCRFSGVRLLTGMTPPPMEGRDLKFSHDVLKAFFMVTTPGEKEWRLVDTTNPSQDFVGSTFLDEGKKVVFIADRHIALVSGSSSERVVTLPFPVSKSTLQIIGGELSRFVISLKGPCQDDFKQYCANLIDGGIVKLP